MIRATTPKQVFIFDTDPAEFVRILITYAQGDEIILEKHESDLTVETITDDHENITGYRAWFRLTQEEANRFRARGGKKVYVQVRALTYEDEALASGIQEVCIHDVLNDEVLVR